MHAKANGFTYRVATAATKSPWPNGSPSSESLVRLWVQIRPVVPHNLDLRHAISLKRFHLFYRLTKTNSILDNRDPYSQVKFKRFCNQYNLNSNLTIKTKFKFSFVRSAINLTMGKGQICTHLACELTQGSSIVSGANHQEPGVNSRKCSWVKHHIININPTKVIRSRSQLSNL